MVPAAYDEQRDPMAEDVSDPLARLDQSIRNLFPRELATLIFATLGPADERALDSVLPAAQRLPRIVQSEGNTVIVLETQDCTCARQSDWCWWGTVCTGGPCYPVDGCGTWWRERCMEYCETPNQ
ncbi:MAG: bacteriocin fulvocin C-related protein [Acidobacteria bacterium]|nr:bacteriocin fulvocin C-related protein [Acidobacteriota bacterium]MBV9475104.1 bacteriocin fulvocin C-related protein [Acidobacteriota bacterium]